MCVAALAACPGEYCWSADPTNSACLPPSPPLSLPLCPPCPCSEFPGELQRILEWFRDYKVPDGKPLNAFGYDNKELNKAFANEVVEETHGFWLKLKNGSRPNTDGLSTI